jgi:hypothetical protein
MFEERRLQSRSCKKSCCSASARSNEQQCSPPLACCSPPLAVATCCKRAKVCLQGYGVATGRSGCCKCARRRLKTCRGTTVMQLLVHGGARVQHTFAANAQSWQMCCSDALQTCSGERQQRQVDVQRLARWSTKKGLGRRWKIRAIGEE